MDTAVYSAIGAVRIDDENTVRQWFELVCQTYTETDPPEWEQFKTALTEAASSANVDARIAEEFIQHLSTNDPSPIDTVRQLNELSTELPELYRQQTTPEAEQGGTEQGAAEQDDQYDESAWQAFLTENGPRWNGAEDSWEQFRVWFLYEAEQRGLSTPATGFVDYVVSQPDKVAVFKQYGISVAGSADEAQQQEKAPDISTFPEVKEGDTGEWVEYLDKMLTSHGF